MNLIVAVDEKWGIGKNNQLLTYLPEDLKYFKEKTWNQVVVLGRTTLETFPNQKPLPGRTNIILTTNPDFRKQDMLVCHSIEEILLELQNWKNKEVFISGGGSIYRQFLPYCDTAYVTKMKKNFEADVFFPNLDENSDFVLDQISEVKTYHDMEFQFTVYKRVTSI